MYVRLIAEHHRHDVREVVVPLVEAEHGAAEQVAQPVAREEAHHAHRGDGREGREMVWPIPLDRVDDRRRPDLGGEIPRGPTPAGLASGLLIPSLTLSILHDRGPCGDRILPPRPLALVVIQEHPPDIGVLRPHGAVGIPGRRNAPLAASRLVARRVGSDLRPVGLLEFPTDQPVFDEHLPGAGTRTVHTVTRAHGMIVGPALAVEVFPIPRLVGYPKPPRTVAVVVSRAHGPFAPGSDAGWSPNPMRNASMKGRKSRAVP